MKSKDKIQIEAEYKIKLKKLLDLNKAYFERDNPEVSDLDFDNLKNELVKLNIDLPDFQTNFMVNKFNYDIKAVDFGMARPINKSDNMEM